MMDDNQTKLYIDLLQEKVMTLENKLETNDAVMWEMLSNILSALAREGIIVKHCVQAKYDPEQTKLENATNNRNV